MIRRDSPTRIAPTYRTLTINTLGGAPDARPSTVHHHPVLPHVEVHHAVVLSEDQPLSHGPSRGGIRSGPLTSAVAIPLAEGHVPLSTMSFMPPSPFHENELYLMHSLRMLNRLLGARASLVWHPFRREIDPVDQNPSRHVQTPRRTESAQAFHAVKPTHTNHRENASRPPTFRGDNRFAPRLCSANPAPSLARLRRLPLSRLAGSSTPPPSGDTDAIEDSEANSNRLSIAPGA